MRTTLLSLLHLCIASACLWAAPAQAHTPTSTGQEIESLFSALRQSGCEFNRNGTWYNAHQASEHLQSKYAYLQKKNLVPSAEAFIDRAASQSSMSNKAYTVRCPSAPEVSSKQWFTGQLAQIRKNK